MLFSAQSQRDIINYLRWKTLTNNTNALVSLFFSFFFQCFLISHNDIGGAGGYYLNKTSICVVDLATISWKLKNFHYGTKNRDMQKKKKTNENQPQQRDHQQNKTFSLVWIIIFFVDYSKGCVIPKFFL